MAVALLGCSGPLPSTSPGRAPTATPSTFPSTPTPTPSDAAGRALVLRLYVSVGAPLQGVTVQEPAYFSLYENGDAIYVVGTSLNFELRHARLSPEQRDALLADALDRGGLRTAESLYNEFTFESTHIFEFHAQGIYKRVTVIGLGFGDSNTPSAAIRSKLDWLAKRLTDFGTEVAAGGAQDLGAYRPLAYWAALNPPYVPEMTANADWPWPDLTPSQLIPSGVLAADQGEAVITLGINANLIARAPGGALYQIVVRPLLPDEVPS